MSFEIQVKDQVATFTFSARGGAISGQTLQGLQSLIARVNSEEEMKGLVLTGAGHCFSSGFDLGTFISFGDEDEIKRWFQFEEKVMYELFTCSKPVIAAINGHATAAGMIICMACDHRLVMDQPKTKIGMNEIRIGLSLTPAEGEIMRFGLDTDKNFRDMVLGGRLVGPQEAVERGFFDELVTTREELMAKARAKVYGLIDTPGRPFIALKRIQKKHAAAHIVAELESFDWDIVVKIFTDPCIIGTLAQVKDSMNSTRPPWGNPG